MQLSRFRTSLLLLLFTGAVLASSVTAAPQEVPQVAKNMPEPQTLITVKEVVTPPVTTASVKNLAPSLARVGVQSAQTLTLSLNDAVKRALENNNDIEVSRDDVRFQETQIRSIIGAYDPVFSFTPNFTRNSTTGSAATNDFRVNSNFAKNLERGGGNYQVFFNNQRTENAFAQAQVSSGSVSSSSSAIYSSSFGINYVQPLARNFRIDNTRRQITIARKRLEQTDSDFRLRATDTITTVQRAYWDFVFALRNQQNQVANINLAVKTYARSKPASRPEPPHRWPVPRWQPSLPTARANCFWPRKPWPARKIT